MEIKVIIGLGNPGPLCMRTRHNVGFCVVEEIACRYNASWHITKNYAISEIVQRQNCFVLMKPLKGMNDSSVVVPFLKKKGIAISELLVIHDELELPFGKIIVKHGGSAKGHNGLRSLIATWGIDFWRMRCGIGRPLHKDDVASYVLSQFSEATDLVRAMIFQAADQVCNIIKTNSKGELF